MPAQRPPSCRLLVAALLLLLPIPAGCSEEAPQRPVRVVLVTLDTLRWDAFAGETAALPRLADAAAGGLVFEQFYSSTSSTQPSHASMFTGLHPWQHGVTRNGMVLGSDARTVTEQLSAAGFDTAAVVASFPLERRFGYDQGFDVYVDHFTESHDRKQVWNEISVEEGRFFSLGEAITDEAIGLLDEATGARQFFWFHYFDPHPPYGHSIQAEHVLELADLLSAARTGGGRADLERLVERARRLYDRDVAYLDDALARLLDRLAAEGDRIDTHVVLVSDHGESFGEDGSFGHSKRVTAPQVHVPCVILSPRVEPGRRSDPAGSVDVAATLLDLAGLPWRDLGAGRSLLAPPTDGTATAMGMRRSFPEPGQDVRADGSVVPLEGSRFFVVQDGRLVLGDARAVVSDPPLEDAERLARIRELFAALDAELTAGTADELLDPETQAALEALGYTR